MLITLTWQSWQILMWLPKKIFEVGANNSKTISSRMSIWRIDDHGYMPTDMESRGVSLIMNLNIFHKSKHFINNINCNMSKRYSLWSYHCLPVGIKCRCSWALPVQRWRTRTIQCNFWICRSSHPNLLP